MDINDIKPKGPGDRQRSEEFNAILEATKENTRAIDGVAGGFQGDVVPAFDFTNAPKGIYSPTVSGPYGADLPDGGVVVDLELYPITELVWNGEYLSKRAEVEIVVPEPENKIPDWVAGTYETGEQRNHNGQIWQVVVPSTTQEPGSGTQWAPKIDKVSTEQYIGDKANLFKNESTQLFPSANLIVRRYQETSFNDYSAGYSQTPTPDGLRVAIPAAGSSATKFYIKTGEFVQGRNFEATFLISETSSTSSSYATGIGYIAADGSYIGYSLTQGGVLRGYNGYSVSNLVTGLASVAPGDKVVYALKDSVLSVFLNDNLVVNHAVESSGFQGELLIMQAAFPVYTVKFHFSIDPIRDYVKTEIHNNSSSSDLFYSYNPAGNGAFTAFVAIGSGYFVGFNIVHHVNMAELVYLDYWRITGAQIYTFNGSIMVPTSLMALGTEETEFVYKRNSSKIDFTGGYHGDEILIPGTEKFLVDGVALNSEQLSSSIPLTPCKRFEYRVNSNMTSTADSPEPGTVVPGHPSEFEHQKRVSFGDKGCVVNNLAVSKIDATISVMYTTLVTARKDVAKYVYTNNPDDNNWHEMIGDGFEKLQSTGAREFWGMNPDTGFSSYVKASVLTPMPKNSTGQFFVRDRIGDSKPYFDIGSLSVSVGTTIRSQTIIRFGVI